MKEKTLDIVVAGVLIVGMIFLLTFAGVKMLSISDPTDTKGTIVEDAVKPVKKNGRWVLPSSQVPDDAEGLMVGPALALIPARREDSPSDSGQVSGKDRAMIANSISGFLGEWETFNPNRIQVASLKGRPNPYKERLRGYVTFDSLNEIASRDDASDPPGVCIYCYAGLTWVGAGDIESSMKISDHEGSRAYAAVSGIVKYTPVPGALNPRSSQHIARSYGLIMKKESNRWLVERAATDEGKVITP